MRVAAEDHDPEWRIRLGELKKEYDALDSE